MMKHSVRLLTLCTLLASGSAWADGGTSCVAAQEVFANAVYHGDTSTSTSFIGNFGGVPSPGPDLAFKFNNGFPSGSSFTVTVTGGWNAGAVIVATCGAIAGPPLAAGTGTSNFSVPLAGLAPGTLYYLIVTGNPSDNSGPSGPFTLFPPVPVTLQSFSID